jgi:uncharacterized Zn finger protein (UPF0148 family)
VQIRYRGKVYCTNEDNLEALLNPEAAQEPASRAQEAKPPPAGSAATDSLRKLMEEKLSELSKQLNATTDLDEQTRLLDLISKYVETLEKIKHVSS